MTEWLIQQLIEMDKSLEKNDVNATLRKVHECLEALRKPKGEDDNEYRCFAGSN